MPETVSIDKSLAEAVAKFVDTLHHIYSGIKIRPGPNYEDEDFAFEITIPKIFPWMRYWQHAIKSALRLKMSMTCLSFQMLLMRASRCHILHSE